MCGSPLLRNAATRERRAAQGSKNTETKKVKKEKVTKSRLFFALFSACSAFGAVFGAVRTIHAEKWSKAKATHNLVAAEGPQMTGSGCGGKRVEIQSFVFPILASHVTLARAINNIMANRVT